MFFAVTQVMNIAWLRLERQTSQRMAQTRRQGRAHSRYQLRLGRQVYKKKYDTFITKECLAHPLGTTGDVSCMVVADWTAALSHKRPAEATCQYEESSNMCCVVIHVPNGMRDATTVAPLAPRLSKRLDKERGLGWRDINVNTIVFFVHSKVAGSALVLCSVLRDVFHILNRGCLPDGSAAEAFHNRKRLLGSKADDSPMPTYSYEGPNGTVHIELTHATEPIKPLPEGCFVKHVCMCNDGCSAQFRCGHTFHIYQRLGALFTNVFGKRFTLENSVDTAGHGKGEADGAAKVSVNALERVVAYPGFTSYGTGVLEFVRCLAAIHPTPRGGASAGVGKAGSHNRYYYISYPDDGSAFDAQMATAESGFAGSSTKYFFRGLGGSSVDSYDPTAPRLMVQEQACGCDPCIDNNVNANILSAYSSCLMQSEFASPTQVNIVSGKPLAAAARATRAQLEAYARSLNKGSIVVVRVDQEDGRQFENEVFFLGLVTQAPTQLDKKRTFAGQNYPKGWWFSRIRWLHFQTTTASGHRFYIVDLLEDDIPWAVSHFDHHSQEVVDAITVVAGCHKLSAEQYQKILDIGDLVT